MAAGLKILRPGERKDQPVKDAQHHQRGQRVNVALLEDDIDIHQPVAQDRVGPGHRDQNQREHGHLLVMAGQSADHIRHSVNQGERHDPEQRSVAQILQLPPDQRIVGVWGLERQHRRTGQIDALRYSMHARSRNQLTSTEEAETRRIPLATKT